MLDQAVEQLHEKYDSFIKITGRHFIANAQKVTNFNCPGLVIDLNRRQRYAQTYIMYFTSNFYRSYIKGLFKEVNDN